MSEGREEISEEELRQRVVFSLMLPAVRLSALFSSPIKEAKKRFETAYYQELKRRGLKMREAVEIMDASISKVALLSKQLKQSFMRPERDIELPRRIEYMLWSQPLSAARLSQVMPDVEDDELQEALTLLLDEERIVEVPRGPYTEPRFDLNIKQARRVWDGWIARIDGLNNALATVAAASYSRFFAPDLPAFARTLNFHIRREDIPRLHAFYEEQLFPFIAELDRQADEAREQDEEPEVISLSLFWALADVIDRVWDEQLHADDPNPQED